jgi:hypothetical protein
MIADSRLDSLIAEGQDFLQRMERIDAGDKSVRLNLDEIRLWSDEVERWASHARVVLPERGASLDFKLYWEEPARAYILRVLSRLKATVATDIQQRDTHVREKVDEDEIDPFEVGKYLIQLTNAAYSTGNQATVDLLFKWIFNPPQNRGQLYAIWALWLLGKTGFYATFENAVLRLCESKSGRDILNALLDGRELGPDGSIITLNLPPEDVEKWKDFHLDSQKPWMKESEKAAIAKGILSEFLDRIGHREQGGWESRQQVQSEVISKVENHMLDPTTVPILLKVLDFIFGEGSKILQERRERRKDAQASEKPKADKDTPPPTSKLDLAEVIQSKEAALSREIATNAWSTSEAKVKHLLSLLETYTRNYYLAKEQYAKYGSALVPPIVVHNLSEAEDGIATTVKELETILTTVYGKRVVASEVEIVE